MTAICRPDRGTPQRRALSVDEFAAAYGMGVTTIYEAIKRGELASFKILSRRFIPLGEDGQPIRPTLKTE